MIMVIFFFTEIKGAISVQVPTSIYFIYFILYLQIRTDRNNENIILIAFLFLCYIY